MVGTIPPGGRIRIPGTHHATSPLEEQAKDMKIDFHGTYEHIKRVINSPAQPARRGEEDFSKLLGSIAPGDRQAAEKAEEKPPPMKLPVDRMAHYKMPEPNLKLPELTVPGGEGSFSVDVNELSDAAKGSLGGKPKILKARRISSAEADRLGTTSLSRRIEEIKEIVRDAGKKHAIDPALGMAVAANESSFNPNAVSNDGYYSKGLFQLLDSTGRDMRARLDVKQRYNPFNPDMNVDLGVGYLRYLHDIFSNETELPNRMKTAPAANSSSLEKLAVAAFNAGEGRVASAQARASRAGKNPGEYDDVRPYLPDITQKYVEKVMASRTGFEGHFID